MMRTIIIVVALAFLASCGKEGVKTTEQPEAVQNAFKSQYSDATKVSWEKDGDLYTVEFETEEGEKEVTYDKSGKVLEVEWEILVSALPSAILNYIGENYAGYEIEEAEKIEKDSEIYYAAEIEGEEEELELIFDAEGNYLGLENEDGDGDGDDEEEEGDDEENEIEISIEELPQTIKNAILESYPGAEFLEADKITQEDGSITYDVEISLNGEIIELMYDPEGNFLGIEGEN